MTATRSETIEERALRLALEATDPHVSRSKRTRARVDLGVLLERAAEPALVRLVSAIRLLTFHPALTNTMPATHDAHGDEL